MKIFTAEQEICIALRLIRLVRKDGVRLTEWLMGYEMGAILYELRK